MSFTRALGALAFCTLLTIPSVATPKVPADAAVVQADAFDASFDRFEALPPYPQADEGAVNLTEIEPPVEVEEPESDGRVLGRGVASYYGAKFHGRRTASGEAFDMHAMTAAHKRLPFGSRVKVTNPSNGKSVIVKINDRGPYAHGRLIDLSRAAATQLGLVSRGHGTVELALLD